LFSFLVFFSAKDFRAASFCRFLFVSRGSVLAFFPILFPALCGGFFPPSFPLLWQFFFPILTVRFVSYPSEIIFSLLFFPP